MRKAKNTQLALYYLHPTREHEITLVKDKRGDFVIEEWPADLTYPTEAELVVAEVPALKREVKRAARAHAGRLARDVYSLFAASDSSARDIYNFMMDNYRAVKPGSRISPLTGRMLQLSDIIDAIEAVRLDIDAVAAAAVGQDAKIAALEAYDIETNVLWP